MIRGRSLFSATLVIAFLGCLSTPAFADLEWHQVMLTTMPLLNVGVEGGRTHTRNFLRGGKFRTEQIETGLVRIVDLNKRTIWIINPGRQVYAEFSLDRMVADGRRLAPLQIEGVKAAVEKMRDSLEVLLEDMPADRQRQVRERLSRQIRALEYLEDLQRKPEVKRTEEQKMIAGLQCRLYRKLFGDTEVRVWMAENVPFSEEFRSLSRMLADIGLTSVDSRLASAEADEFPMLVVSDYLKSEVIYLEDKTLDDSLFEVPAGYERVEAPAIAEGAAEQGGSRP